MRLLCACAAVALSASAQVGFKIGAPVTALTETTSGASALLNRSYWWTAGPAVEFDLPRGFSVEANALYRRVGFEGSSGRADLSGRREFTSAVWDFPLLAKYRFTEGPVQPFLGGGYTYRRLGDLLGGWQASKPHGVTLATGVRLRAGRIKLTPEFRYTYWPNEDIQPAFRIRKNQVEVLAGLTF